MNKIKVVVSTIHFPLTMARYFINAFSRREDVSLYTVGPFTGNWIPWNNGMTLEQKYVLTPDFPLPKESIAQKVPVGLLERQIAIKPDLWIDIDAGWRVFGHPECPSFQIQTDPHVLKQQYKAAHVANRYDIRYCMQTPYIEEGEVWLPYGYDPTIHYPEDVDIYKQDVCLIGLQYEHRNQLIRSLNSKGITCKTGIGIVYDEYRHAYNESRIALSWSSLQDTPARVYEAFGMKVPLVANRTPDLMMLFKEDEDFVGFSSLDEAVVKVSWVLNNYDTALKMAENVYNKVSANHTWDKRVERILDDYQKVRI